MNRDEIVSFVKQQISDQLCIGEPITEDMRLDKDLGADSLDVVELIMSIEDKFKIDIPDDELEGIKQVGDIIDYLDKKINIEG